MRRMALVLALAMLGGCGEGGEAAAPAIDAAASRDAQRGLLQGDWVVATTWGDPAPDGAPIRIAIADTIKMRSQCVENEWAYSVEAGEVRTRFVPQTICLRPLTRDEKEVQDRITAGFLFGREGDQLALDSGAGPMVLRKARSSAPTATPASGAPPAKSAARDPAAPPLPPVGNFAPPPPSPPPTLRGDWRLAGHATTLHIGRDRIEFENCQQVAWRYTYNPPRLTTERTPAVTIDIRPKPVPCAAPFLPAVNQMVTAFDMAERIERTRDGIRVFGPGNVSVRLVRP